MGHQFATFADLKTFVDYVVSSGQLSEINETDEAPRQVNVRCNGDHDYSEAVLPNDIWVAKSHWYPSIVLHELAHLAVQDGGHTTAFLYAYLTLIREFMGGVYEHQYHEAFVRERLISRG